MKVCIMGAHAPHLVTVSTKFHGEVALPYQKDNGSENYLYFTNLCKGRINLQNSSGKI
jgi:hypothetical protein